MSNNKTITINGRLYDAVTGLPVKKPASKDIEPIKVKKPVAKKPVAPTRSATLAKVVHTGPQRSTTLRRSIAKKPVSAVKHPTRGRTMDIARSAKISKFAPHPVPVTSQKPVSASKPDKAPQLHPIAERALKRTEKKVAPATKTLSGKEIKDAAIEAALNSPKKKTKQKRQLPRWKRRFLIAIACAVVVIGATWAIYRFVPSISVSIASNQAGVSATYPEYTPDGFRLHQPVTYSEGQVVLVFASNSNEDSYSITQTKSSWDSTAVLDNIVRKAAGENYSTTTERGLTIYSYNTHASWVNAGVLYTIESNAQLSNEQIRRIATSL